MRWPGRPSGERGAGSVLVLAVAMVVLAALLGAAVLASGQAARRQAAAAADLAALAAAGRLAHGPHQLEPCEVAAKVAAANGGRLGACVIDGLEVEVQVTVRVAAPMAWLPDQHRRARAGPSEVPD